MFGNLRLYAPAGNSALDIFVLFMSVSSHGESNLVELGIAAVSTMLALVIYVILWPFNVFLQVRMRKHYDTPRKWIITFAYALSANSSKPVHRN